MKAKNNMENATVSKQVKALKNKINQSSYKIKTERSLIPNNEKFINEEVECSNNEEIGRAHV